MNGLYCVFCVLLLCEPGFACHHPYGESDWPRLKVVVHFHTFDTRSTRLPTSWLAQETRERVYIAIDSQQTLYCPSLNQ